jgi:probable addiction module antidote protein
MERKRKNRTIREIEEEYFRNHPEEIDAYVQELFKDFIEDESIEALFASLRVIAKVKGVSISDLAKTTGMTRQGVQHALSNKGNPRFDNVSAILREMGYQLTVTPMAKQGISR